MSDEMVSIRRERAERVHIFLCELAMLGYERGVGEEVDALVESFLTAEDTKADAWGLDAAEDDIVGVGVCAMSNETDRTAADVIRDVVRGLCGLPSDEIAWRVVDALEMAGYRIVPLRERTLTAKKDWRQRCIAMSGVALAELLELEIYRASEAAEKDRAIWAHTLRKQVVRGELNCLDADEWYTGGYGEGSGGDRQ